LRHLIASSCLAYFINTPMPSLTDAPFQTTAVKVGTPCGCHETDRIRACDLRLRYLGAIEK